MLCHRAASYRLTHVVCASGPTTRQVRWRQWLFPQATKGWRPERFEHEGQALQFARQSKRIPIWKLGWATSISRNYLEKVEQGEARLLPECREELERVLGVPLKRRRKSRLDRTP
ncbi:unnamed protein product [Symbiodinium necroappetens]|uniref:HTH cro/C1-type domain-containing protein n=1 Tax=Symbiodinium necroappetens TaxID=1628268 RepID=A0A812IW54_9DINO|nr:unnamed protein product [Symbiodinium necroappetens]